MSICFCICFLIVFYKCSLFSIIFYMFLNMFLSVFRVFSIAFYVFSVNMLFIVPSISMYTSSAVYIAFLKVFYSFLNLWGLHVFYYKGDRKPCGFIRFSIKTHKFIWLLIEFDQKTNQCVWVSIHAPMNSYGPNTMQIHIGCNPYKSL